MTLRTVAIVGRPNVGKSTLFNRIVGQRRAVVHEMPGVTRDRIGETADWAGHGFYLIDTGGIVPYGETVSDYDEVVTQIARQAIVEADVVIFLVDGQTGPLDWDESIAKDLRKSGRPVVLGVNKTEKEANRIGAADFYRLGLGEPFPISALHGVGVGDLMDRVVEGFPDTPAVATPCDCSVAIVGRPNVGKSSLLNQLVGRDEALVSEIAGTTRDSIHTDLKWHGKVLRLIDTAGLRRKGKVKGAVEYFSNLRTIRSLEQCDVAVLMIDASTNAVMQDSKIAGLIHDSGKGVVVAFNKWDLVADKGANTHLAVWEAFCREIPFLTYAPWFTFSALTTQRIGRILETVWDVHEHRQKRIATSELNAFLERATASQPPRAHQNGVGKIYFGAQVETAPPTFVLSVNEPAFFARNYLRYLNNQLRATYGFPGSRIFVKLKKH
ncbi:MAG TPA: ribosome biogenesis GTPase Der [Candidatus Krumholzibacteria bacterium]|nr:ribosome biogenesis GTPase Der [Candidatus Krumholzibacteria bacterium]HPD71548.1 ribosome biogenesis GTPase Der [Candidatus Krumholzibacteria bacterium]HRY41519.1 ribosome biogenesis GTPase Der [Candidatus Krumholzibacteria bacterium]